MKLDDLRRARLATPDPPPFGPGAVVAKGSTFGLQTWRVVESVELVGQDWRVHVHGGDAYMSFASMKDWTATGAIVEVGQEWCHGTLRHAIAAIELEMVVLDDGGYVETRVLIHDWRLAPGSRLKKLAETIDWANFKVAEPPLHPACRSKILDSSILLIMDDHEFDISVDVDTMLGIRDWAERGNRWDVDDTLVELKLANETQERCDRIRTLRNARRVALVVPGGTVVEVLITNVRLALFEEHSPLPSITLTIQRKRDITMPWKV